jgi:hypothetical protein
MQKRDNRGQGADGGSGAAALMVQIDAEAAEIGIAIRRVADVSFKILPQGMRHERGRDGVFDLVTYKKLVAERNDCPVNADTGRRVGDEQKIAATALDELREPAVQFG